MILAASRNDIEALQLLHHAGAHLETRTLLGATALMLAVSRKNVEAAKWLLQAGANPSVRDKRNKSAWDIARQVKSPELEALLAQVGSSGPLPPPTAPQKPGSTIRELRDTGDKLNQALTGLKLHKTPRRRKKENASEQRSKMIPTPSYQGDKCLQFF